MNAVLFILNQTSKGLTLAEELIKYDGVHA